METIVHNVGELGPSDRTAAEALVGHALAEHQQLVIQVVDVAVREGDSPAGDRGDQLPEWCNVYAGLSDEQIAELEGAISRRLDLTRSNNVPSMETYV
jgi:hypothetical protein